MNSFRDRSRDTANDTYLRNADAGNYSVGREGRSTYDANVDPIYPRGGMARRTEPPKVTPVTPPVQPQAALPFPQPPQSSFSPAPLTPFAPPSFDNGLQRRLRTGVAPLEGAALNFYGGGNGNVY